MARQYKAIMHFNKQRVSAGFPWTVHYRGVCYPAKVIDCRVPMQSEWKPNKKANPRAFFTAKAEELLITEDGTAILSNPSEQS